MSDIFLSYSSVDRTRVQAIVAALEQRGWSVWWDQHILPGKTWDHTLGLELTAARCVVVVWSQHSVESDWVRAEALEGKQRGILVPVLIDPVECPWAFRTLQCANLAHWSGAASSPEFDSVAAAVSEALSKTPIPAIRTLSARDQAEKVLARALRRRTRLLVAAFSCVLVLFGVQFLWYFNRTHLLLRTATSIGLTRIERGKYSTDENERLGSHIREASTSIYLLMPNAYSFSQTFRDDLETFFKKGNTTMRVIFANPATDFYREMTEMTLGPNWKAKDFETNMGFVATSRHRLLDAAMDDDSKISFRYFDTQFRVPLIIIDDRYCFLTVRLDPNEGNQSPRLEFRDGFAQACVAHFQRVWSFAKPTPEPQMQGSVPTAPATGN